MNDLSVNEAAEQLHVSSGTVRRWIGAGKLPATRRGRYLRIRQSDVTRLTGNSAGINSGAAAALRPGSPAALLHYMRNGPHYATPADVDELDRHIREAREEARRLASREENV